MNHNLDPQMQAILHSARGRGNGAEVAHHSQRSHYFNHDLTAQQISPHSSLTINQGGREGLYIDRVMDDGHAALPFQYAPPEQQRNQYNLDEFDRQLLHDFVPIDPKYQRLTQTGRISIPFSNDMSSMFSNQQMNNVSQQRQPIMDYVPLFNDAQSRTMSGPASQHIQMSLPGPSRVRDVTPSFRPLPVLRESAGAPLTANTFENRSSTQSKSQRKRQLSSPFMGSSPTQRVSLRRAADRPKPLLPLTFNENESSMAIASTPISSAGADMLTNEPTTYNRHHAPPVVRGIQLVSPYELPDRFRQVFSYPLFNPVQSKCFELIYKSTDNVVVSAPTGSGKTALLELAICKLVDGYDSRQFKIVYQAPTKSLCSERARDWQKKFSHLNLPCAELTGDTDAAEMRSVGNAAIIVTTPEKWDSITRKWKDHVKLLQMVKLFLIDEVHILKDARGATLEAVVSRMKSIGAQVRFIALSATVPNSQDIATWLGRDPEHRDLPARRETFGEEFRPVVLEKHVYGFDNGGNDFSFDAFLDSKLPNLVAKHTRGKPIMVFCFTRKSCEITAGKLAAWWAKSRINERAWPQPKQKVRVGVKELQELISCGVAFHHAGLDSQDRFAIETAFREGGISVICCTSTLAVGVNLPCHLVVIKNTVGYQEAGLREYSDLELMQMLGRAGRPQFDRDAIAIILTRSSNIDRYQKMISGQEIIESTLHLNLIEHLNSEIGLGTVHDVDTAKQWLAGTFLSVRMKENPTYYNFNCDHGSMDADERLKRISERDIKLLQDARLITSDHRLCCTDYGLAMSKYMVAFETMRLLLSIPKQANMGQMLHIICQAAEFRDLRMKPSERAIFRDLNISSFIKFPIKENITTSAQKVSLIVQVQLGGVDLPARKDFNAIRKQYMAEKVIVFDRIQRLLRCVVDCKIHDCDVVAILNALELGRSVSAGFWDNSPLQLRQIDGIGPAAVRKLVSAGTKTVEKLKSLGSDDIERIMSRNPPFGTKILGDAAKVPSLALKVGITQKILKPGSPVTVQVKAEISCMAKTLFWKNRPISVTFVAIISSNRLGHIWRGSIKKLSTILDVKFTCELSSATDTINCYFACDDILGTTRTILLTPKIPAAAFPPNPTQKMLANDDDNFHWDDSEVLDAFDTLEGIMPKSTMIRPQSDYGEDLDGFMDIDDFDTEPQKEIREHHLPVKMENGRWHCNHACRGGNTKKGAPCKHDCCRNGLLKPPKIPAPKKVNRYQKKDEGTHSKPKPPPMKLALKDPGEQVNIDDIEEIDLASELPPLNYAEITPRKYRTLHDLHTKVQSLNSGPNLDSGRLPKQKPVHSYESGVEPSLDFLESKDDRNSLQGDDEAVPLSSQLLKMPAHSDYESLDAPHTFGTPSPHEFELLDVSPAIPAEDFSNDVFDFDAFGGRKSSFQSQLAKRGITSSPVLHETKRVKLDDAGESEETNRDFKMDANKPLPDWTNEISPELLELFVGYVDFEP